VGSNGYYDWEKILWQPSQLLASWEMVSLSPDDIRRSFSSFLDQNLQSETTLSGHISINM
jgi:hypothetical protein